MDTTALPVRRLTTIAFGIAATLMLVATLRWQLPMMLWDHLDLLPVYEQWQDGTLDIARLLAPYNGAHVLTLPYLSMLATAALGGGSTWLDGVASWLLMVAMAAIVIAVARQSIDTGGRRWPWLMLVLLALYPGHLANLQWGWQVPIFFCLLGVVVAIAVLAGPVLTWPRAGLALLAGIFAGLSFGASVVLIPVAIVLIALRSDTPLPRRLALLLPWLALGCVAALLHLRAPGAATAGSAGLLEAVHYTLNFLGAGVARFATNTAPWLALLAIVAALDAWLVLPPRQRASAWLGFLLFGLGTAALSALGRVGPYGADQAFAQRYISFSVLFWLGWFGLLLTAAPQAGVRRRRIHAGLMATISVLLVANALHLVRKAAITHERGVATATAIAASWPDVDEAVLRDIYFDQPEVARERLRLLHRFRFAPFDRVKPTTVTPPDR